MFQQTQTPTQEPIEKKDDDTKIMYKYKNILNSQTPLTFDETNANTMNKIDAMLETEKKNMNSEPWNKLDKRLKIQKLHAYAEKYGKENSLPMKEVKGLKTFFSTCLTKDKLSKVKDVDYNKETGVINNIGGLAFNLTTRAFTIRNLDKKVSTLKSLTPKKIESVNGEE
jgi:phosphoketolase